MSTHGQSMIGSKTYRAWISMKRRCYNPRSAGYRNYGGRGITVCSEWLDSFVAFRTDMGESPLNSVLDRIDNELGYSKDNCRWVSKLDSNRNRRCVSIQLQKAIVPINFKESISGQS